MHNSIKRRQIDKLKTALDKAGDLTPRQIDMVATAAMSMPDAAVQDLVGKVERDPKSILNEVKIPGRERR